MLSLPAGGGAEAGEAVSVEVNGEPAVQGLLDDGVLLVPARPFLALLGADVTFDASRDALVVTRGSKVLVIFSNREVALRGGVEYSLGAPPRVVDGLLYVPARPVAEALGDDASWVADRRVLAVTSEYARRLMQAGKLPRQAAAAAEGEQSKPSPRIPFTDDDVELLARLVSVEAWGEPYEGMVAVAAVVVNRVLSPRFPDTIRDVVFQPGQFPPARNGRLERTRIHPQAREAVLDALYGADPTGGALYFYNPRLAGSTALRHRPTTVRIGNHVFAR